MISCKGAEKLLDHLHGKSGGSQAPARESVHEGVSALPRVVRAGKIVFQNLKRENNETA